MHTACSAFKGAVLFHGCVCSRRLPRFVGSSFSFSFWSLLVSCIKVEEGDGTGMWVVWLMKHDYLALPKPMPICRHLVHHGVDLESIFMMRQQSKIACTRTWLELRGLCHFVRFPDLEVVFIFLSLTLWSCVENCLQLVDRGVTTRTVECRVRSIMPPPIPFFFLLQATQEKVISLNLESHQKVLKKNLHYPRKIRNSGYVDQIIRSDEDWCFFGPHLAVNAQEASPFTTSLHHQENISSPKTIPGPTTYLDIEWKLSILSENNSFFPCIH